MEVPRAVAVRDDESAHAAELPNEIVDTTIVVGAWLDERLHADVVALLRLRKQTVDRALRLDLGLLAGREHVIGLVLRRLNIRLVERIDLEIRPGDRDRELPTEELA